jgi:hypothetical protein
MSSSIVAFLDEERVGLFHQQTEMLTPIVGTDRCGPSAVLGVGYIRQSTGEVTVRGDATHCVIHAWRAMCVFKRFPMMTDPDALLQACWTITDSELDLTSDPAKLALRELGERYGAPLVRTRVPPLLVLEDMVAHLHDGVVFVDLQELKTETRLGRIADTARLRQLMARIERDRLSLVPPQPPALSP